MVTKFPFADGSRRLEQFSVGCVDGFSKILLMLAIVSFVDELEMTPESIASSKTLSNALQTFSLVRCCYDHRESPQQHYLDSLRDSANISKRGYPFIQHVETNLHCLNPFYLCFFLVVVHLKEICFFTCGTVRCQELAMLPLKR